MPAAKINIEWGRDRHNNSILIATKARGKISIPELQEAMQGFNYQYEGMWAILFTVREDSYQGWFDDTDDPKGDVLALYQINEGETCPVCSVVFEGLYCPKCGERMTNNGEEEGK